MNPDGTMAQVPHLEEFCGHHGLKMASVAELIRYRLKHERYIQRRAEGCIETEFGEFRTVAYSSEISPEMHLALIRGEPAGHENVLVRMQSHCVYGDVFGSCRSIEIAGIWCANRCARLPRKARACWSTCTRPDPVFALKRTTSA